MYLPSRKLTDSLLPQQYPAANEPAKTILNVCYSILITNVSALTLRIPTSPYLASTCLYILLFSRKVLIRYLLFCFNDAILVLFWV